MRNVDLPPVESLSLRCSVVVMIVVPSFAEGDQRDEQVVTAVVLGVKAALPKNVRQGIYRESAVIQHHRADEESPDEHLKPRGPQ